MGKMVSSPTEGYEEIYFLPIVGDQSKNGGISGFFAPGQLLTPPFRSQ